MSKNSSKNIIEQLESQNILLWVNEVCSSFYDSVGKMISASESWYTGSNTRSTVQYLLLACSRAIADDNPQPAYNEWNEVKKHAFALKNAGQFYIKQDLMQLEKKNFALLDKIIVEADKRIVQTKQEWEKLQNEEIQAYKQKYDLWQRTSAKRSKSISKKGSQ